MTDAELNFIETMLQKCLRLIEWEQAQRLKKEVNKKDDSDNFKGTFNHGN